MPERPALTTMLSAPLVAFTIEFDNEFEHQVPHRTSAAPSAPARPGTPWLVSQVMWANVMAHVPDHGVTVDELGVRARTTATSLAGLERWGYLTVRADPAGSPAPGAQVVTPTAAGRRAGEVWRPLAGTIEDRWRQRFGAGTVDATRSALAAVLERVDLALPHYLPVVYPTQNGRAVIPERLEGDDLEAEHAGLPDLDLSVLLSRVLLSFTLDAERATRISLPVGANTLRVADGDGVRVRDLPRLTGVSKEANAMATGFLRRRECVTVEADPSGGRGRVVRLTPKGRGGQVKHHRAVAATEAAWRGRFGTDVVGGLRDALHRLVGEAPTPEDSPLFEGLTPYPDGWRAAVRPPTTLPHYPMVLHRGGYPDGS